jgi:hypothetical protein
MFRIRFVFLGMLMAALAACESNTAYQPSSSVILPLESGNRWIGETVTTDPTGVVLRRSVDTTTVVSERVYGVDRFLLGARFAGLRNRADGLHVWSATDRSDTWRLLPYPALSGETITHAFGGAFAGDSLTVRVLGTDEAVATAAGAYRCYHYEIASTFNAYVAHVYLAPDIGFVRAELRDRAGDGIELGSSRWELTELQVHRSPAIPR